MPLISHIAGVFTGLPILVIAGGPSMEELLDIMPADYPRCVISVNGHGFKQTKFKVDYMAYADINFSKNGEPWAKLFPGVKSISRWSTSTYRVPDYTTFCDSGQFAIEVAGILGGHPIVVGGVDRNRGPQRYWWSKDSRTDGGAQRVASALGKNADRLINLTRYNRTQVRVAPGMKDLWPWPVWDPIEVLPRHSPCRDPRCATQGKTYRVLRQVYLHPADLFNGGAIELTDQEAFPFLQKRWIQ
jgi:hypothetical protein